MSVPAISFLNVTMFHFGLSSLTHLLKFIALPVLISSGAHSRKARQRSTMGKIFGEIY